MTEYILHKWSVTEFGNQDPYLAPECKTKRLVGYRDDETRKVITGPIVSVDGKKVTTYSGSVYHLDDVNQEYLAWLIDHQIEFDPDHPIKFKEKL